MQADVVVYSVRAGCFKAAENPCRVLQIQRTRHVPVPLERAETFPVFAAHEQSAGGTHHITRAHTPQQSAAERMCGHHHAPSLLFRHVECMLDLHVAAHICRLCASNARVKPCRALWITWAECADWHISSAYTGI